MEMMPRYGIGRGSVGGGGGGIKWIGGGRRGVAEEKAVGELLFGRALKVGTAKTQTPVPANT